jgi:ATP-dependent helicase/nuclease subunit B
MYISTPKATLHKMLINNKKHPLWAHVNAWFTEHKEWKNQLLTISKSRRDFSFREISLNQKLASDLYKGQIMYSATRLNSYAECPFRYFLQYGLKARERDQWELNAADTGSYAHEVIRRFCERIDSDENLSWAEIDEITCTEIVDEIVNETISQLDSDDLKEKERTKSIFMRMGKTVKEAAKAVRESIVSGDFLPLAYEKDINISFSENVGIKGTIDRLDVCRHDGINEYRIIDYKTGSKDFKVADIYNRCDMQPVIYALVLRMLDTEAKISGMYYSKVRNDFANIKSNSKQSTAFTQLKKNTELTGATFVDTDSEGNIIAQSADRVETEFARINSPMIFKKGVVEIGGNIRTRQCGERLMETVRDNVLNMDKEIRGGNIEIAPLNNGSSFNEGISSCKYCPYSPACKFDEDIRIQREINEHDSEIWAMLEEDE